MTFAERACSQEPALAFPKVELLPTPFRYAAFDYCLTPEAGDVLLEWFDSAAPWQLVETDFYEQYELDLTSSSPPDRPDIFDLRTLAHLRHSMEDLFSQKFCPAVKAVAHKLVPGQRIGIHNDYLPGQETHRLLIQINHGLTDEAGGFFMVFNSRDPHDIHEILRPRHLSGLAFEISPNSFHAVSQLHSDVRYTLVFSLTRAE
jgi:hypothetical protein